MGNSINKQEGLMDAAYNGRFNDVREYLKDEIVNVNWTHNANGGITALFRACWKGHRDVVELLLDHGADIETRTFYNSETLLMITCIYGHASTTKLLLDRGCAINAVDNNGNTALHWAITNSMECVKELLTYGADTSIKNKDGETPLDKAKDNNNQTCIDLLMEHKKRREQHLKESKQNEQLSSKVESIVSYASKQQEMNDMIASTQEEMNQAVQKLTRDFESKIEALRIEISAANQHTISSVSNLSTIVENLSMKVVSSSQAHHDSNTEIATINEEHVGEDHFEMLS